ncbi:MAG: FAD-binding oxidoreductase [Chroococcidiopsidaceae cyanobacterium CP_BM_ER_R8_30]|nr:FAD-binding oxidoreductase [Chroococcidiopsidaceae cyanobacterium CP_BM_ER_R8_30]
MTHVVVIGCGVVGAAIAYELSQFPVKVTVLDRQLPAKEATGAALGVLMGVISHKVKGNVWRMRQASIQRYETLIPELEALTGCQIPFNRQGILELLVPRQEEEEPRNAEEDLTTWEQLVEIRRSQGWRLEIWDSAQVKSRCPHLVCDAAIYSPQDRQVEPVALTLAMVDAAQRCGVTFHFGVTAEEHHLAITSGGHHLCQIQTKSVEADCEAPLIQDIDWLVVAAGLGSVQCLQLMSAGLDFVPNQPQPHARLKPMLDIRPVLGQALHLQVGHPLGNPDFQPVITGDDVHIVPVREREYWVGATVEFPTNGGNTAPDSACLQAVMKKAISFCPSLAAASIIKTWSGLRPRPEGRPAPIIGYLPGYSNVLLATGHYRNGVLLAPATAQAICEIVVGSSAF